MTVPWIPTQHAAPPQGEKWQPNISVAAPDITIQFKQWNGSAWVEHTAVPKVWNGTEWVTRRPKRWDGLSWVAMT